MSTLSPDVHEILDALYTIAGQWRIQHGPDYGPLFVIGAIIRDLHADKPRRLDADSQVVYDALSELASHWYQAEGENYPPLGRLDQLLAQMRRGAYRGRKARKASKTAG
jgi:hypothetical protein